MNKDIEQRIAWINERVPLDGLRISYIKLQMQEHTKLLIDEIAELKKQVEYQKSGYITLKEYLKTDDILGSIMKLKSELKASKSEANEALQKSHDELLKLQTAIEILEYHQEWRLGKREDMIHEPKKLTEALDIVLSEVKKFRLGDVSTSNQIKIKKYETKN